MSKSFLSVPTMLRAMFRLAEGPHAPRMYCGAVPSSTLALRDELLASSARPELMVRFLAEMDRKLDAVLAELQRESLHEDFPLHGRITELGGESARLEYKGSLAKGSHLELLVLLEEYPLRIISVLARVEASGEQARTGNSNTAFRLGFVDLEEADREHIIRFVFGEERKRIRKNRDDSTLP